MTEGDRAFYKRRAREELQVARALPNCDLKALHLAWAGYFNDRLDGRRRAPPPPLPAH